MRYQVATVTALLLAFSTIGLLGEERSPLEVYFDLTIARLQLIRDTWGNEARPPTAAEVKALFERHGFSAKEYYRFSGTHRKEIAAYLESNPDIADEIEYLSQQIQALLQ